MERSPLFKAACTEIKYLRQFMKQTEQRSLDKLEDAVSRLESLYALYRAGYDMMLARNIKLEKKINLLELEKEGAAGTITRLIWWAEAEHALSQYALEPATSDDTTKIVELQRRAEAAENDCFMWGDIEKDELDTNDAA